MPQRSVPGNNNQAENTDVPPTPRATWLMLAWPTLCCADAEHLKFHLNITEAHTNSHTHTQQASLNVQSCVLEVAIIGRNNNFKCIIL